ncbi:hypothetical protein CK489_28370 [Bradyrhizobium sp. UFLA03-84]|nr:hypothetical protein CK489_28370 [Bradyrhizobium sp. UFLA03-84]
MARGLEVINARHGLGELVLSIIKLQIALMQTNGKPHPVEQNTESAPACFSRTNHASRLGRRLLYSIGTKLTEPHFIANSKNWCVDRHEPLLKKIAFAMCT